MFSHFRAAGPSQHSWQTYLKDLFISLLLPLLTFFLVEFMVQGGLNVRARIIAYNYVFYLAAFLIVAGLIRQLKNAVRIYLGGAWAISTLNYVVTTFRSTPIMPSDIFSVGTAVNVAGGYSFPFSLQFVLATLGFIILGLLAAYATWEANHKVKRLVPTVLGAATLIGFGIAILRPWAPYGMGFDSSIHQPDYMMKQNGTLLTFVRALRYQSIEAPEDYSIERVRSLTNEYQSMMQQVNPEHTLRHVMLGQTPHLAQGTTLPADATIEDLIQYLNQPAQTTRHMNQKPDIVAIMNESFSDPRDLTSIETNIDITPIMDQLSTDTQHGTAHVSVIGGNTAVSEFEFLTGASMAHLPHGVIAYQQFLEDKTPSLVSLLNAQGYTTHAFHPFHQDGWERDRVYPLLGFDTMTFLENWGDDLDLRRDYISDASVYRHILDTLDKGSDPQFVFTVTMQNHGPYGDDYPNFDEAARLIDPPSAEKLDQYISLIHESDLALGQFLAQLKERERPTLVVFFGDHQPNNSVMKPIIDTLEEGSVEDGETIDMMRRRTPYFIWSNYDIPEETGGNLSLNFLANKLLDQTELKRSPWLMFLKDVQTELPIMTGTHVQLKDGEHQLVLDGIVHPVFNDYAILQYNYLIDVEHRVDELFELIP